ncbi:MAG: hypothetical protein LBH43_19420 [Treponema sp.]|jgi:hypothetical protein|nr:hypothetical protein [Treponema sp.]
MKRTSKPFGRIARTFGIIAAVAIIGFSMAACDTGGNDSDGIDMELWSQIEGDWEKDDDSSIYAEFSKFGSTYNLSYNDGIYQTVIIKSLKGGVVSFTIDGHTFTFTVTVANGKLKVSNCTANPVMNGNYSKQ